jgi:hypothetical protein
MKSALKLLFLILFLVVFALPTGVKADVACSVSVSPQSADINSETELNFTVTNDGANNISWVKITKPSGDFTITGSHSGFSFSNSESDITFTGLTIRPGVAPSFSVLTSFGANSTGAQSWQVEASEDGSSSGPCSGNTGVAITNPNPPPPQLVSLTLSELTSDSINISWVTDQNTDSKVSYGTTVSLGTDVTDNNQVTNHSISLTGLTPASTYYYQVVSSNSLGTTQSSPNYFTTFSAVFDGPTPTPADIPVTDSNSVTNTVTNTVIKTIIVEVKDTTPPSLSFTGKYKKIYQKMPEITGIAKDDTGVGRIDFSVDNGKNWLPVDSFKNLGNKKVNFDFSPPALEDGNYAVKVRAFDPAGNIGYTDTINLVIDRLPPQVGGSIISVGPQVLEPDSRGEIVILPQIKTQITLSAVGGATGVEIENNSQEYSLTNDPDSGLWSGNITFSAPGTYRLTVRSVDGAGNITNQSLNTVRVLPQGTVDSHDVGQVKIAAFVLEPDSGQYVLWDGLPYGQVNPQNLGNSVNYSYFLPAGKYYLELTAPHAVTLRTSIFNLNAATPVNADFLLDKRNKLALGPWEFDLPQFLGRTVNYQPDLTASDTNTVTEPLISQTLPFFSLTANGETVTPSNLLGRPMVITLLNTWWPDSVQQLNSLETVSQNSGIGTLVIIPQESDSQVTVFKRRGNFTLPVIADPDGTVVGPLTYWTIPTHLFVDRHGVVQKVRRGILNSAELMDNIVE